MFPESVKQWETILDDLPLLNDRLARRNDETENNHHWLGGQKVATSESQLTAIVTCVAQVVAAACGGHEASSSIHGLAGKPDIHISSDKVKMVGRVIPFWDLYVHEVALWEEGTQFLQQGSSNQTLHDHFQEHHDDEYCICNNGAYILHRKAYEVIGEMTELMVKNQLKYGSLTTWNLWWFLRTDGRTLWISRSFARDARDPTVCQVLARLLLVTTNDFELNVVSRFPAATNMKKRKQSDFDSMTSSEVSMTPLDARDPTVCQVLGRLLLVAMNDFELDVVPKVPVETKMKKRKQSASESIPSAEDNMTPLANVGDSRTYHDLCVEFSVYMREISSDPKRLSDFMSSLKTVFLGYGRIGNSFKATVDMGGDRQLEVVVKVAETFELKHELALEAYVYKKLSRFQGKCIPFLFVDAPVCRFACFNSTCLIMSYEGTTMDMVDVTSLPLCVRERARDDNLKIENAGVEKL
ncbi:unnamed protein product, partial [Aphanomyces euteiches]